MEASSPIAGLSRVHSKEGRETVFTGDTNARAPFGPTSNDKIRAAALEEETVVWIEEREGF